VRSGVIAMVVLLGLTCDTGSRYIPNLKIIPRSEWGSVDIKQHKPEHDIEYITIHHGGVLFTKDSSVHEYLRNLQSWSRNNKKWIDIPYHFVMDLTGNIYQARDPKYPGDTNTDYDPTGHLLICILGNYEQQQLNPKQLDSLVDFLVHFSISYKVPVANIKSHKDYADTACPGKNIYIYLQNGTLNDRVAKELNNVRRLNK
jgi:hypothetical protein